MRNTTINVSFNTEKLDALKFHMEKRDTDLQGELNDTVQKLKNMSRRQPVNILMTRWQEKYPPENVPVELIGL